LLKVLLLHPAIIAAPFIDLTSFSIETSFTALAEVSFLPPTG
jgi:hypothetical protein